MIVLTGGRLYLPSRDEIHSGLDEVPADGSHAAAFIMKIHDIILLGKLNLPFYLFIGRKIIPQFLYPYVFI